MARLLNVDIPVGHGLLEGLLRLPDAETPHPWLAAVVCHPHPVQGGTLNNKVAFRIAQAFVDCGVPALRFNFRGVGRSTGSFDDGRGERDDVRAALDELQRRYPGVALAVGGISFGSWVGLPVGCADERVRLLMGVGVPVATLPVDSLADCAKPKLIVQGQYDEFGPEAQLRAWFDGLPDPKAVRIVAGADHLFTRHQTELYDALLALLRAEQARLTA